jgi:hypothetical protein
MGSSTRSKPANKILGLITAREADAFLVAAANLQPEQWELEKISETAEWFAAEFRPGAGLAALAKNHSEIFGPFEAKSVLMMVTAICLRTWLRKAWDAADERHRDWYLFQLRQQYLELLDLAETGQHEGSSNAILGELRMKRPSPRLSEPPPLVPLEAVLYYLQTRIGDRAKHCGNTDCPKPYFIAEKRWQKYCSEACAGPANREAKRKWWHEHYGGGGA